MSTAAPGIGRRGIGSDARHTESVRQLIGKGKVFRVGALADLLDLDLLERREKLVLIGSRSADDWPQETDRCPLCGYAPSAA